jgi:hypothetical protein
VALSHVVIDHIAVGDMLVDGTWLEDGTDVRLRYPSTAPGSTDVLPELFVSYLAKTFM